MIYDNIAGVSRVFDHVKGYAIHEDKDEFGYPEFSIYTDDGRGNGDCICRTSDLWWARRIAQALDEGDGVV